MFLPPDIPPDIPPDSMRITGPHAVHGLGAEGQTDREMPWLSYTQSSWISSPNSDEHTRSHTEIHADSQRHREMHTQTHTHTHRQIDTDTHTHRDIYTERGRHAHTCQALLDPFIGPLRINYLYPFHNQEISNTKLQVANIEKNYWKSLVCSKRPMSPLTRTAW